MSSRPGEDYVLLSWIDFGTWDLTAVEMLLKSTGQMVRAPPGYFLAELLAELRRDCLPCQISWLFDAFWCPASAQSRVILPTFCLSGCED